MNKDFIEPILLKAGDNRVKINGQYPYVDCRIISEDNYQLLLRQIRELNEYKIQAYEQAIEIATLKNNRL